MPTPDPVVEAIVARVSQMYAPVVEALVADLAAGRDSTVVTIIVDRGDGETFSQVYGAKPLAEIGSDLNAYLAERSLPQPRVVFHD